MNRNLMGYPVRHLGSFWELPAVCGVDPYVAYMLIIYSIPINCGSLHASTIVDSIPCYPDLRTECS